MAAAQASPFVPSFFGGLMVLALFKLFCRALFVSFACGVTGRVLEPGPDAYRQRKAAYIPECNASSGEALAEHLRGLYLAQGDLGSVVKTCPSPLPEQARPKSRPCFPEATVLHPCAGCFHITLRNYWYTWEFSL